MTDATKTNCPACDRAADLAKRGLEVIPHAHCACGNPMDVEMEQCDDCADEAHIREERRALRAELRDIHARLNDIASELEDLCASDEEAVDLDGELDEASRAIGRVIKAL